MSVHLALRTLLIVVIAQNRRVMQQYRQQAAMFEQGLHRSRDEQVGQFFG